MTISIRMTNKEGELIKKFAEMKGITVSELVRQSVMQRIEDEIDMETYEKAMSGYEDDGRKYSHNEAKKILEQY